jgi:hypothetical protein
MHRSSSSSLCEPHSTAWQLLLLNRVETSMDVQGSFENVHRYE